MKRVDFHNLNVFFSASSSKLKKRSELYSRIIRTIYDLHARLTYDWLSDSKRLKPDIIYSKSIRGLEKADLLIAEITFPSIGVGEQISLALNKKKPVLALYQKNFPEHSRFALGMKSPYLILKQYNLTNLKSVVKSELDKITKKQFIKFNFITTQEISDFLHKKSESLKISRSNLLRRIISDYMKSIQ